MSLTLTNLPSGFHDDPYPHYACLRDEHPVCAQPDGTFIISRHVDLDMIYRDTARFVSDKKKVFAPKYGTAAPLYEHHTTSLVFNDPPLHTRVRKIMVGAMNPRALASMEPGLITLVDGLLDELEGQGEVDLIEAFAGAIPIEVIGNLFNIPRERRAPLRDWSLAILGALEPQLTPEQEALGNQAVLDFVTFLREIVDDRRLNPGDPETDVLTRLIQSEEGRLSPEELYQNCIFILNAGHETTTNLIGNALMLLDRDRAARARLIAEPELITTAVDEFLRMESPNQFGNRLTTEPMTLQGVDIPTGTDLHLCIGAANRDPAQFENPRMEGRVAVNKFLTRFPEYEILPRTERSARIRFRGFTCLPANLG